MVTLTTYTPQRMKNTRIQKRVCKSGESWHTSSLIYIINYYSYLCFEDSPCRAITLINVMRHLMLVLTNLKLFDVRRSCNALILFQIYKMLIFQKQNVMIFKMTVYFKIKSNNCQKTR